MQWGATNEWDLNEWLGEMNYQGWIGPNGWGRSIPTPQHKRSFAEGGKPTLAGETLKTDHGGKEYGGIYWALKTNARAVSKTCLY